MSEQEQPAGQEPAGAEPAGPQPTEPAMVSESRSGSGRARTFRTVLTSRAAGWVVAAALAGAVVALSITSATTGPGAGVVAVRGPLGIAGPLRVVPGGQVIPGGPMIRRVIPFGFSPGGPAGAFMAPFGRVIAGIVTSVSASSFTITTRDGQTVTVDEQSSTAYRKAGVPTSANAVTAGARVAVLGSPTGSPSASTITATVVAVLPAGGKFLPGAPG